MQQAGDDARALQLEAEELQRRLAATHKTAPDVVAYDRQIAALKADVLRARRQVLLGGMGWLMAAAVAKPWGQRGGSEGGWGQGCLGATTTCMHTPLGRRTPLVLRSSRHRIAGAAGGCCQVRGGLGGPLAGGAGTLCACPPHVLPAACLTLPRQDPSQRGPSRPHRPDRGAAGGTQGCGGAGAAGGETEGRRRLLAGRNPSWQGATRPASPRGI